MHWSQFNWKALLDCGQNEKVCVRVGEQGKAATREYKRSRRKGGEKGRREVEDLDLKRVIPFH